jgi:hypothetical protein
MNELSYYDVGTREKPVVSNSSMSSLNPEEGGSIAKFMNFFSDPTEKERRVTPTLKNGKLIHLYIEKPEQFAVENDVKPTEMMAEFLGRVIKLQDDVTKGLTDPIRDIDTKLQSTVKKAESAVAELQKLDFYFEKFSERLKVNKDQAIKIFRAARNGAYKSYNEGTLLAEIIDAGTESPITTYMNYLLGSRGKVALSKDDHAKVTGAITSLSTHPEVSLLLGLRQDEFAIAEPVDIFKEQPVFWKEDIKFDDNFKVPIQCKALLDRLIVNHRTKSIKYVDLKTTSGSIYTFQYSFEDYRYYRQMAFYKRAIAFWFVNHYSSQYNLSEYTIDILLVPVETKGLFLTGIYDVDQTWLHKGTAEARSLLQRLAYHMRYGEYRYSIEEMGPDKTYKHLKFKPAA